MHEVLVNRLGGLSLPRESVVRLTDRPDMTLDVYCGRKTTIQQQQRQSIHYLPAKSCDKGMLRSSDQLHTCQLSEIFMGETARELTFFTHLTTKRMGKVSWNFHGGDIFLLTSRLRHNNKNIHFKNY